MKIRNIISLIILGVLFFSCDKIDEDDYTKPVENLQWNGRKILLEEFTGHRCTNCPAATEVAKVLARTYPNIILVSIHAGNLARPTLAGEFTTDYRIDEGTAIYDELNVPATPMGLVSRNPYQNQVVLQSGDWANAIASLYYTLPVLELSLEGSYDETSRKIQVNTTAKFNEIIGEDLNIVYAVIEDSLISPQLLPNETDLNYVHQHVLRQMPSSRWGEQFLLKSNKIKIDEEITVAKEIELIEKVVPENCSIVVYITRKETREILQVEELAIKELINNVKK